MSRRDPLDVKTSEPATLAAALRALPDAAPTPDLWPGLAQAIEARRTRRRWRVALPAAIAAAIALALLLPNLARREGPTSPVAPNVAEHSAPAPDSSAPTQNASDDADELSALGQRSRTLERWIAEVAARAPQDGRDLMAAVEVEDLIGLVDVQLNGARDAGDALPLWRQRVALLEDLATIRGNAFALAANDVDAHALPTSFNPIN